ncbi:hypothetical protein ACFVQ0_16995 [Streptomyces sp. NPDC057900]|uniref:hypothetical protein n=1 Tax=Streptomyces sp. NPDC057900 TaxID=3346274 RepID=UPI0036EAABDA
MTRWGGTFARRRGGRTPAPVERAAANLPEAAPEGVVVEDHDGLLLLRTPTDATLTPADVADLSRGMRTDDGTVTVVAGAESTEVGNFWPRLSELLDSLRDSGTESVQLVMAGAGHDAEDRPATARRIADGWGFEVRAPDGPPLVVPGGSLFVPVASTAKGGAAAGGWWRFAPGAKPQPLGPRSPEPSWQSALRGVPSGTAGGCVVEEIPAGLLVRPAGAAPAEPGDLYHAVPVDPRRAAVVVGVPYGEDVSAEEVAEVLGSLPQEARSAARLVPGGRRDVLSLAQSVSDRTDADVEVLTGLPLVAAGGPLGTYSVRSVLAAPDGTPTWMPFVDAVVCRPPDESGRARPPRVLRWTPPLPGPARPEEGVVGLTDRWQVTVTRAGLWVGPRGGPSLSPTARQVDPGGPVIELGMPGEVMDASLWPALSGLLGALAPALRARATLHVHGVSLDGGLELRRLSAQHGLRTLRYAAPAPAPARARPPAPARPAPAPVSRPGAVPGPQTQSSRPELPPQPSRPGSQGRTTGSAPVRPSEGGGRAARAERAGQLREAMATGAAATAGAGAGAGASVGAPGRPAGPGTPGRPAARRATGKPGTPRRTGAGPAAEELDGSDDDVPIGSLGRARRRAEATREAATGTTPSSTAPLPDQSEPAEPPTTEPDRPEGPEGPEGAGSGGSGSDGPREPAADTDEGSDTGDARDGAGTSDGSGDQAEPAAEETPAASDGPEPLAERSPSEEPAREPAPREPAPRVAEAPDRPDDVLPAKPLRVESAAPADPAPATPPASPGSTASRDVTAGVPTDPDGPGTEGDEAAQAPNAPAPPDTPAAPVAPEAPAPAEVPDTPLAPVPLDPGHRSTEAERTAFRALADRGWDRHGAAVARSLARLPALRGKEQEAARADLIALRMYLLTPEGPLSHGAVVRALREYEPDMLPYGACVASALNRLPSYRGAVLRGTGGDPAAGVALPRPGTLLRDAALLSTTPLDATRTAVMPGGSYVIWSVAGRRVRQLADQSRGPEEVVFAPGTLFRVLDVRRDGPSAQIFLRELTGPAKAAVPDPDADRAVLARLDEAVRGLPTAPESTGHWPERCFGAVGAGP